MSLDFSITLSMNNGDVIQPSVERIFNGIFNSRGAACNVMYTLRKHPKCVFDDDLYQPTTLFISNSVKEQTTYILLEALSEYNIADAIERLFIEYPATDIKYIILEVC